MRNLWGGVGAVAAIAYGSLGFAVDASAQQVAVPDLYNSAWAGFYAGVNGGGNWGDSSTSISTAVTFDNSFALTPEGQTYGPTAAKGATGTTSPSNTSFIGGGQLGFNVPLSQSWMAGIEADIDGLADGSAATSQSNSLIRPGFAPDAIATTISTTKQLNYLSTVRARFGYLFEPTLWVYATGGLAVGDAKSSTSLTAVETPNTGSTNVAAVGAASKTMPGYTVGIGTEWLMDRAWSLKAEYLYYRLGNLSYSNAPFNAFLLSNGATDFTANSTSSTRFSGNIVRVGLNYHF
jgi:outer membrane immunogenic protein